jgi:hypothetical protein
MHDIASEPPVVMGVASVISDCWHGVILIEENEVFPRAALALDNHSLADMGREFSSRRK